MSSLYIPFAGFLTGILVGLTGIGGGAVMTPILLLIFGIPPKIAIATDLWFAMITKIGASFTHQKNKQVDWKIVTYLWIGSLPAAFLCSQLITSKYISHYQFKLLIPLIAIMLLVTSLSLLYSSFNKSKPIDNQPSSSFPKKRTIILGGGLGAVVASTSIGAGALGTVLLLKLFPNRLTLNKLIGTDIMHAVPLAFTAGISYFFADCIDFKLLGLLLIGSIPGAIIGSHFAKHASAKLLKLSLSGVLMYSGLRLLI